MKRRDYIAPALFVLAIVAGLLLRGFWGGAMTGISATLFITVTIGRINYRKAERRINAAMQLHRMMTDRDELHYENEN